MSIHGGLSSIETEVEFLAGILGDGTAPSLRRSSDLGWLFHNRPLLGATRFFYDSPPGRRRCTGTHAHPLRGPMPPGATSLPARDSSTCSGTPGGPASFLPT